MNKLPSLPVGLFNFERIRTTEKLYVDKTGLLLKLIDESERVFLSRPRRFGKSLTLSTLDAMFSGKAELFKGLAAEAWTVEQAKHPNPVLRIDISLTGSCSEVAEFERKLGRQLRFIADEHDLALTEPDAEGMFDELIRKLHKKHGPVVLLVDEYDKPVLDNLQNPETAEAMRRMLRSIYTVVKGCEDYLRFAMLTGISKFTKIGVFSAINNLSDISLDRKYGALCGYTQDELEHCFAGWINVTAEHLSLSREVFLAKLKDYYDGFSFDGAVNVYNPFSTLQVLQKGDFRNYWYESGSPWFVIEYMKRHGIMNPENYRHMQVEIDFASSAEIERAKPESFLFQSGYLTIEKREEETLTLDYPNKEVLNSISRRYLELVYEVQDANRTGNSLWQAFVSGDLEEVKRLYSAALASMPYRLFANKNEDFYQAVFLALLRGAGIKANGEVESHRGRSDVEVLLPGRVFVLEFKTASDEAQIKARRTEGDEQIVSRGYAAKYADDPRPVTTTTFVIDLKKRAAL